MIIVTVLTLPWGINFRNLKAYSAEQKDFADFY